MHLLIWSSRLTSIHCFFCFQTQLTGVLLVTIFAMGAGNKQQKQCPWTCTCVPKNNGVVCKGQYWSSIPTVPINTSYLEMHGARVTELHARVLYDANGANLTKIVFSQMNLMNIEKDAFWGLRQLRSLSLNICPLEHLDNGTLSNLPSLTLLRLTGTKLTTIPKAICQIANLSTIDLHGGHIKTARFDACFETLHNLSLVSLTQNPLNKVTKEDFFSLRFAPVKSIGLTGCKLKTLEADVFRYLPRLTDINIGDNHFTQLNPNLFSSHKTLKALQLQGNRFTAIPSQALSKTTWLKDINLGHNKIQKLYFPPVFLKMINLRSVELTGNKLGTLRNATFENLSNCSRLTTLVLSRCNIKSIEAAAFSPLRHMQRLVLDFNPLSASALETGLYGLRGASNLQELSILLLNLASLTNTTFRHLSGLPITSLKAQRILDKTLPTGVFQYFPHLEQLDLMGSATIEIEADVFSPLKTLTFLQLGNNKLVDMPLANKVGLTTVETLYVSSNPLRSLSKNNCRGYFGLVTFDASNCAIVHITEKTFQDMQRLQTLHLDNNKIAYIHAEAFYGLQNLRILTMKSNRLQLTEATAGMLSGLSNLLFLNFRENPNTAMNATLVSKLLSNLTSLTRLDMSSTRLSELPVGTFDHMTQLTQLALSANSISYWNPRVFRNLTRLEMVSIRDNKITLINRTSLVYVTSLRVLDVSGNPFSCTCDLLWFRRWIYSSSVFVDHLGPGNTRRSSGAW